MSRSSATADRGPAAVPPVPETETVDTHRVSCDGGQGAFGHPRVFLRIGPSGFVECPYCDKRFILRQASGQD